MNILVTGAKGFVGRNLVETLKCIRDKEGDEAYTSHNTNRLDVDGVVKKIMTTDYVREELEGRPHAVEA